MDYDIIEEDSISLYEIFQYFKKWAWLIIAAMCLGAIISLVSFQFLEDEEYQSSAQLIVNQKSANETIQYSEIQTNVSLINTYRQIILGKSVLEKVAQEVDPNLTVTQLQNAITVRQTENAQTFDIVAVLDSPELAQNVVQSAIRNFENTLTEIYDTDILTVYVLSAPSYEPNKIATSITTRALIGAILGAMLTVGILLLKELLDTTVKDENFLNQFGLVKLGELESLSEQEYAQAVLTGATTKKGR
ncbi:LPS chain length-determining protein [Aerococcaceae bacterium WS4759]|uniref:Capsular polysaccharide biosynthesis protein CpsC n=1 Tax=Fundicoccus ignavus TaxID=2664442 RepID=A0A6I2GKB5_9LACT|nr:Wzz/FepE/Etk N-terminal domain-containing protein [Fundicoccus ignavus]MRI85961.1 LPS chain length-determining protein [Fundicoccus ignavus]